MKFIYPIALSLCLFAPLAFAGEELAGYATRIVELSADKVAYIAGEKAILRMHFLSKPDNDQMEFDATATIGGVDLPLTRVTDMEFYAQTPALAAGTTVVQTRIWIQDSRYARDLKKSIEVFSARMAEIDSILAGGSVTDPVAIANLQAERAEKVDLIAACQAQITNIRSQVSAPRLNIIAN